MINHKRIKSKKKYEGMFFLTNQNYYIKILNYKSSIDVDFCFLDGNVFNGRIGNIVRGNVENPMHKSLYNIGFTGIGNYKKSENSLKSKSYKVWCSMFQRCYDNKDNAYKECLVKKDWHNYQVFAKWFNDNYLDGFELDKDILFKGNKIYSSETCCFVPKEINLLFVKRNSSRGDCPIGVSFRKDTKKYTSCINVHKKVNLGCYSYEIDAFNAYKKAKKDRILFLAEKYKTKISKECYSALIKYEVEITD